jgi:hypothetical protein
VAYLVIRVRRTRRARDDFDQARRLFETFHAFAPPTLLQQRCERKIPDVLVKLGRLRGLIYTSDKGRCGQPPRTYIHFMNTMPLLACDPAGKQLHILGGRYRVTARGIEG